jgi:hypothetical protein
MAMEQPGTGAAPSEDTIEVLVVDPTDPAATITDQSLHVRLPHLADAASPRSLAPEALGQVVAEVARQVDAVMAHVETAPQHVQLDTISVAVALSATGGVQWVMNLSGTLQGTLSLTFKIKQPPTPKTIPISALGGCLPPLVVDLSKLTPSGTGARVF